ncbi:hypothetical protein TIFTF001_013627 [Ficus carica]|uniref:F-box associated beta-propeller type 1 domain-containing protein n=1 Tax=Ficus carica TaxID=3494 RepID=A0AA87ZV98_FICCA|nr:hypothetical protein TIFTF001_013627 [Ficus carica]
MQVFKRLLRNNKQRPKKAPTSPSFKKNWQFGEGIMELLSTAKLCVYWNPAIMKKVKKLPPPPLPPPPPNTSSTYTLYGFGYQPLTNDFKVVAITARLQWGDYHYFKRDDEASSSLITKPTLRTYSIGLGGSVHWLLSFGRRPNQDTFLRRQNLDSFGIVAFDLSTEEFKLINAPPSVTAAQVLSIFSLSRCLSLVARIQHGLNEIRIMNKYGVFDSWTKHLSVDLVNLPVPSFQSSYFVLIGVSNHGNLLLGCKEADDDLAVYDPKSDRVQYLCPCRTILEFTTYAESIFLS